MVPVITTSLAGSMVEHPKLNEERFGEINDLAENTWKALTEEGGLQELINQLGEDGVARLITKGIVYGQIFEKQN